MSDDGIISSILGQSESEPEGIIEHVEIHDIIGELQRQREEAQRKNEELEESDENEREEMEVPYTEAYITRPMDEQVIQSAVKRFKNEGAKEIHREEVGVVEEPGQFIDNASILLDDFDNKLQELHDGLKEKLMEQQQTVNEGFRHLGDEDVEGEDHFAYIIAHTNKGILIGGASNIIDNIAEHMGLSPEEREFVRLAYDESIRASEGLKDITSHLLLDDILMVFDPDEISSTAGISQETQDHEEEDGVKDEEEDET